MAHSASPLHPTWEGHVQTTWDACILFEACLSGRLAHVPRRPHDRERNELIKNGSVFIYEEHSSGIKRWTDGVSWSPSRILGNFLIYRELDQPFPPGEKKRALKKTKKHSGGIVKREGSPLSSLNLQSPIDAQANIPDEQRSLIGSLVDSYCFKDNGLIKKTISITHNGVSHHLVSYYNVDDVRSGNMMTPSLYEGFADVWPRASLTQAQNFRQNIESAEWDNHLETRNRYAATSNISWPPPNFSEVSPQSQTLYLQSLQDQGHRAMPPYQMPSSHSYSPVMTQNNSYYSLDSHRSQNQLASSEYPRQMPLQMPNGQHANSASHQASGHGGFHPARINPFSHGPNQLSSTQALQDVDHLPGPTSLNDSFHHLDSHGQVQMPSHLSASLYYNSAPGQAQHHNQDPQQDDDFKSWDFDASHASQSY